MSKRKRRTYLVTSIVFITLFIVFSAGMQWKYITYSSARIPEVIDADLKKTSSGRCIVGHVCNDSNLDYRRVSITYDLYDANDNRLGVASASTGTLQRGRTWAFQTSAIGNDVASISTGSLDHRDYSEEASKQGNTAYDDLRIVDAQLRKTPSGQHIIGHVHNSSNQDYWHVSISYELYDATGNRLGVASARTTTLQRGKTWSFEATPIGNKVIAISIASANGFPDSIAPHNRTDLRQLSICPDAFFNLAEKVPSVRLVRVATGRDDDDGERDFAKLQVARSDIKKLVDAVKAFQPGKENEHEKDRPIVSQSSRLGISSAGPGWYDPDSIRKFIAVRVNQDGAHEGMSLLIDLGQTNETVAYVRYWSNWY